MAVVNITSTTLRVTWDEVPAIDRNGIITEYEVEYNQSTFGSTSQTVRVTSRIAELTELHEYVEYYIRVRAHNTEGTGPYSSALLAATEQDGEHIATTCVRLILHHSCFLLVPSGYPMNITATTISSSVIDVSWEAFPEIDHNGILTHYEGWLNST